MLRAIFFLFLCHFAQGLKAQETEEVSKQTFVYKDTLALDYYHLEKTPQEAPLLVLVHGGGFYSGRRDGERETTFCEAMARKGFAVASISYRLTRKEEKFGCDCPAEKKIETFVKAVEDLSDAVGSLIDSKNLNFDRNSIVIIGSSAGAETVLSAAFLDEHHAFKHITPRKYAGLVSFAGGMINANYITPDNAIPTLMFHGEKDPLVPFSTDAHHYCDRESPGYLILDGSKTIADRLSKLGTSYVLAFDPQGNHDWADIAYEFTDLLEKFINNRVLGGLKEQSRFEVQADVVTENRP